MSTQLFGQDNKGEITSNHILVAAMEDATNKAEHLKGTVSVRLSSNSTPVLGILHIADSNNLQVVVETFFKEDIKKKVGEQLIRLLLRKTLDTNFIDAVRMTNQNIMLTHSLEIESHRITIKMLYFNKAGVFDGDTISIQNDYQQRVKKITEHFS